MKYSIILLVALAMLVVDTEAGKRCLRKRKKAAKAGAGTWAPECDDKGKFKLKQCNEVKCWCVRPKGGKKTYGDFVIPLGEEYDCSKKPKGCIIKRFQAIVKGLEYVPNCDADGKNFAIEQCAITKKSDSGILSLNKPTFQPSEGWGGKPSRAVDGNKNPSWGGATCTHTQNNPQAWWAVDLGAPSTISKVEITNRQDCCSERLANFQIGVTDTSPATQAPKIGAYTACANVAGALGRGETRSIPCVGQGRYLVVQLKGQNYLTLCEVTVYGVVEEKECWCTDKNGDEVEDTRGESPDCEAAFTFPKTVCETLEGGTEGIISLNKPTFQPSEGWGGKPSRAVDGNKNPSWGGATCTHTQNNAQAWWAVDLGASSSISKVEITNRQDCCSERLANFQIGATNTSPATQAPKIGAYTACANVAGALGRGETRSIPCVAQGRYLVVQLKGQNYLTLCEVTVHGIVGNRECFCKAENGNEIEGTRKAESEVAEDECTFPKKTCEEVEGGTEGILSLNKPTFQPSEGWGGKPSRAVDGNKNPSWGGATCTHTQNNPQAWWAVDLGATSSISKVEITNRQDCCSERLANFQVGATDTSPATQAPKIGAYTACANVAGALGRGETRSIPCIAEGRYLVVQLKGQNYLTLCEVTVYGKIANRECFCKTENGKEVAGTRKAESEYIETAISLNKPTFQPSEGWGGKPSRAVDGNKNPSWGGATCTHTQNNPQAWWAVDLGVSSAISRVEITNRQDCCSERLANFQIGTTDTSPATQAPKIGAYTACANVDGALGRGETRSIPCIAQGRYLVVQLKGQNYLTLCEVSVYGLAAQC